MHPNEPLLVVVAHSLIGVPKRTESLRHEAAHLSPAHVEAIDAQIARQAREFRETSQ